MKRAVSAGALEVLALKVRRAVLSEPVDDIHTHLYDPAFGGLLLWGIDDLLVYHYLVAETFRHVSLPYAEFWELPKNRQAELVWETLFLQNSPISEACRGVLTTLQTLGLDVRKRDLTKIRAWFAKWTPEKFTNHCMELAGVRSICMTNSPFDPQERPVWEKGFRRDERFKAALRIDPLLLDWRNTWRQLSGDGYRVSGNLTSRTIDEVRCFLADWTRRIDATYVMVSLPPDFSYPSKADSTTLLEKAVLPHCRDFGLPFAVMPGVRRGVNPALKMAGDGMEKANLDFLRNLCANHPENRFAATVLSRENQHELCVLGRKFRNLHPFGCWWFTNIPSIISEMTRMRVELLGLSFTPQHSDARVLDQILYKWKHSREIISAVLEEKYVDMARAGWNPTDAEIARDARLWMGGTFEQFCASAKT